MVEFDEHLARKKLESLNYHPIDVDLTLEEGIGRLHTDLQQAFDGWLNGDEQEFEFQGITLKKIMEHEGGDYFNALFTMSTFMNDPDLIDTFLSVPSERLKRRCGGLEDCKPES